MRRNVTLHRYTHTTTLRINK
uniref:Uncharacterized protein n=1 Tax=Ralstonia solanacearum TaxID=305 RepID=A0A0S4VJ07_RALSL|nr:protein of unknown function [Ralstonia solanacearum]CUV47934.1 protein of unknown function [Ralstonia solanacearum]